MAETAIDRQTAVALYNGLLAVRTHLNLQNDTITALRADNARLRGEAETDAAEDAQRLAPSVTLLDEMVATISPAVPADAAVPASTDPADVVQDVTDAPNLPEVPEVPEGPEGPDGNNVEPFDAVASDPANEPTPEEQAGFPDNASNRSGLDTPFPASSEQTGQTGGDASST